jgi:hypothetical protein
VPENADPQAKTARVNSPCLNGFRGNGNTVWCWCYDRLASRNAFESFSIGVDSGILDNVPRQFTRRTGTDANGSGVSGRQNFFSNNKVISCAKQLVVGMGLYQKSSVFKSLKGQAAISPATTAQSTIAGEHG